MPSLRLGARASALARWQAEWVAAQLRELGVDVELVPISTVGDRQQGAIETIGGQGVFTKEIQRALLDDRIDLAVHSLKDLPTGAVAGLSLAAVPHRAPPHDALVLNKGVGSLCLASDSCLQAENATNKDSRPLCFRQLSPAATIGTGSLRRRAQLLHVRPDLQMKDVRGNVDTRLRKLHDGQCDALVLAEAGLRRLGLAEQIACVLPLQIMLPAVGQGALALETRDDDDATRALVAPLDHAPTHAAVSAERQMLLVLQGGCLAPVAALGCVQGEQLTLTGRVMSHDGVRLLEAGETAAISDALQLGRRVAEALLAQGAGELIAAARKA
jgi:hydroxymethylbilane synthase